MMKNIKTFYSMAIVTLVALLVLSCRGDKMDVTYNSVPTPSTSLKQATLKVFVENSRSMDGYMCPGSELKDAVYAYLGDLEPEFGKMELYYINSDIIPRPKDLKSFIATLTPQSFKSAGGNRSATDMGELIERVLGECDDSTVSIFISDCILALNGAMPGDLMVNRQIEVKNAVRDAMIKDKNLSVEIIQLKSKFDGTYYYGDGRNEKLHGEQRPYYMWIFGSNSMLAEMNKKAPIDEIMHGVENWVSFSKQQKIPFKITNEKGGIPTGMLPVNTTYVIRVCADMSSILKPESVLLMTDNYSTTDKAINISSIERSGNEHVLSLSIKSTFMGKDKTISYIDANKLPGWVEASSNDSCPDIKEALGQTTGIKYLIGGVADAYKDVESLGEIKFELIKH